MLLGGELVVFIVDRFVFFFSSRRRHTRCSRDWSSDVCSSDLLEIVGSAAPHGSLPLLGRDESIRLQLAVGREEHRRLFGATPAGCWLPECAYRPRGRWAPLGGRGRTRPGTEEHLADAGFRFFFTDAHLARAGSPLGAYEDVPLGVRSEEHTSELQSRLHLVCRLLLEKKKTNPANS